MMCEYCGKTLRQGDTIHGIKYGTLTSTGFKAAQDSAVTVICGDCGNIVYQIVYCYLDRDKLNYPVIFKMYTDLKASMENGYKVIQNIAKLPRESQQALQHLVTVCKSVPSLFTTTCQHQRHFYIRSEVQLSGPTGSCGRGCSSM